MKILFVCKHNIFRSKVAEAYFNKINKNRNIQSSSVGVIPGLGLTKSQEKVTRTQASVANKFGIKVIRNPRGLSVRLLREQDLIILVSNDIPIKIFNNKSYIKKVIEWKIPDVINNNPKAMEKTIRLIIKKIDKLNKQLENVK